MIRVQSEICFHREHNLAMKKKEDRYIQSGLSAAVFFSILIQFINIRRRVR